jgi:1-acyl-sn-glycerol-3-phosphate acyltransferase
LVIIFLKIKFNFKYKKVKVKGNYILLSNHATDFDPLMVASSCPKQTYFVASEHITRFKAFKLLKYAFEPIVRYKGASGASAIKNALSRLRNGANVCIFPEGVRTFDGITCPITYSTAKFVKSSGASLVTYKLKGGYFSSPMWSSTKHTRKGKITGAPVSVYDKETLKNMSVDEIYQVIKTDLYENAYETWSQSPVKYKGKKIAESVESFLYVCPNCNAHASFTSENNTVKCKDCGHTFTIDSTGNLSGTKITTLLGLSKWQNAVTENDFNKGVTYRAEQASISTIEKHVAVNTVTGKLELSPTRLTCGELSFSLADIPEMAIHGKYSLCFMANKTYYELTLPKGDNAYRFLQYFNVIKENQK